ncbi:response regulator transcription factor [bacterium SCSIO 12741]|nr:response regulator transcription factor [bacterium SCSIO 12741]
MDGLVRILKDSEEEIRITGLALNGEEALEIAKTQNVDVMVLDIGMPGMREAASTLKELTEKHPDIQVLILSMYVDRERIMMMIQNGAKGYLLKNQSGRKVVEAIKTLAAGKRYFSREVRDTWFDTEFPDDEDRIKEIKLSSREEEVLYLITKGLPTKLIADELNLSPATIETHRNKLMKKTGSKNVQDLVRFGVINGYYNQD